MIHKSTHEPWQEKEKITLLGMIGDIPMYLIPGKYNHWATLYKRRRRSKQEIIDFVLSFAKDTEAYGEYYAVAYLQKVLKISWRTRTRWTQEKKLDVVSKPGYKKYVSRKSVIAFAKANPFIFCGLQRHELLSLLDESTTEHILSLDPNSYVSGRSVKVKCLETRVVYPSITQAALATHQGRHSISKSIKMNIKCLSGFHWRRV